MDLAYKNDERIKTELLRRIGEHEKLDAIVQGTYGKLNGHFRGCAVGCSLYDSDTKEVRGTGLHALYPEKLGLPKWLAHLEDTIFEGLPIEDAVKWPRRFAEAIPVGANLEGLEDRLAIRRLERTLELKDRWPGSMRGQVVEAIEGVISVLRDGGDRSAARSAAASAARSAAESAARSAASAARSAAWSAARSAAESAASAASAAWSAAWSAAYKTEADTLIEELESLMTEQSNPERTPK